MEFFLQGYDYQLWTIIEEGDLIVLNPREKWTDNDRKLLSQNSKAKNLICCALTRSEFNRISACKSAKEMWDKVKLTYEGTDKVKETRIDILVTQYEKFKMLSGETITQMDSRFTDIGLAGLGKIYNTRDMVRKIIRSLPNQWTPKVTAIEETTDLTTMSLEKLIRSLMSHEINMDRLSANTSKKNVTNLFKVIAAPSSSSFSSENASTEDSDVDDVMSKIHKILKKKKNGSRRIQKKDKKKKEPVCYECRKPGHLRPNCLRLKKIGQQDKSKKKQISDEKHKNFKRRAMTAAWDNEEVSTSDSSSSYSKKDQDNLGASRTKDAQGIGDCQLFIQLKSEEGVVTPRKFYLLGKHE
ncbi:hypothetical protein Taro_037594 [Colocasia esculenta]|uniref:CCHC-type domain-containing protein n=1 Tax=Colocasia esculenta TaxID=4460 RepID=A0A843WBI0_COLES|nr:hypothetical protein [Colocasia esculenta]